MGKERTFWQRPSTFQSKNVIVYFFPFNSRQSYQACYAWTIAWQVWSAWGKQEVLETSSRSICDSTIYFLCIMCKEQLTITSVDFLRFLYLDNLLHCFCPAVQLVEKIWKLFFLLWQRLRCTIFGLAIVPKYPNVDIAFTGKRILVNVTVCWIRLSSFSIIYTFSISTRFQLSNNFPNSSVL